MRKNEKKLNETHRRNRDETLYFHFITSKGENLRGNPFATDVMTSDVTIKLVS